MRKDTKVTEKTTKTSKYKELNDSELEVICGGECNIWSGSCPGGPNVEAETKVD